MIEKPILFSGPMVRAILDGRKTQTRRVVKRMVSEHPPCALKPCPYGQPGDRLWVRETHCIFAHGDPTAPGGVRKNQVAYRADPESDCFDTTRWRPSIFMPRWASRLTLEITAVRVERLQSISEADARAEGCPVQCPDGNAIDWFNGLWDGINAERGYPWANNPWVWVIEFKRSEVTR